MDHFTFKGSISLYLIFFCFVRGFHSANIICYKGSINSTETASLSTPETLIESGCLNTSILTVFFAPGFMGKVNGDAVTTIIGKLRNRTNFNVALVNWEDEASDGGLGLALGYTLRAAPNSIKVGILFGEALVKLFKNGMNASNTHLIGLSLGAPLMGKAGSTAKEHQYSVSRITGLDPAKMYFEPQTIYPPLTKDCADFVDIISTDKVFGVQGSYGTVNFRANPELPQQPGCSEDENKYSLEILLQSASSISKKCSHNRSWRYFADAVDALSSYLAIRKSKYQQHTDYTADDLTYFGINTNTSKRGDFCMSTNAEPPYGKGEAGI